MFGSSTRQINFAKISELGAYQYAESLGASATTSTTFQNKLNLVTPVLPIGTYRIGWTAQLRHSGASRQSQLQITLDASQIWLSQNEANRANQRFINTAFDEVTFVSEAAHTIALNYRRSSGPSTTVTITEARLQIWRVG